MRFDFKNARRRFGADYLTFKKVTLGARPQPQPQSSALAQAQASTPAPAQFWPGPDSYPLVDHANAWATAH